MYHSQQQKQASGIAAQQAQHGSFAAGISVAVAEDKLDYAAVLDAFLGELNFVNDAVLSDTAGTAGGAASGEKRAPAVKGGSPSAGVRVGEEGGGDAVLGLHASASTGGGASPAAVTAARGRKPSQPDQPMREQQQVQEMSPLGAGSLPLPQPADMEAASGGLEFPARLDSGVAVALCLGLPPAFTPVLGGVDGGLPIAGLDQRSPALPGLMSPSLLADMLPF